MLVSGFPLVWAVVLNVWLFIVGLSWIGSIRTSGHFLGEFAIVTVIIFVLEVLWTHRAVIVNKV